MGLQPLRPFTITLAITPSTKVTLIVADLQEGCNVK
jgi:hypothetical protein